MTLPMLKVAPVRKSLRVNAPAVRAFEVFTARFDNWWPKSHHIGTSPMKAGVIEPRTGGRWYEKGEDGTECDWGEVLAWEPPSRVVLSWRLNGKFEIDETLVSEVEVRFIPDGPNATRVELEHRIQAADADIIRAGVDSPGGWSGILESFRQTAEA